MDCIRLIHSVEVMGEGRELFNAFRLTAKESAYSVRQITIVPAYVSHVVQLMEPRPWVPSFSPTPSKESKHRHCALIDTYTVRMSVIMTKGQTPRISYVYKFMRKRTNREFHA